MTLTLILLIVLVLGTILFFTFWYRVRKILLFHNWVYQWKVYFVESRDFSTGTYRYFEVYYKDHQVKLPKEITGGKREVSEFVSAATTETHNSELGLVVVTFERDFLDDYGVSYRALTTLHLKIQTSKANNLLVINPCNGSQAVISLQTE